MTDRERLPDRRLNITVPLRWQSYDLALTIGFHETGMVREVFVNGAKVGSEIEGVLQDACVLISIALQRHTPPSALVRSVGRLHGDKGDPNAPPPTSLLGAILDRVAQADREERDEIFQAYLSAQALRRPRRPTTDEVV